MESCPLGQPRPHVPGCGGKRRRPPGIPGVRGKRLQQVPNLGSPGPLAWHSVLRPRLRVRVCWVKRVGCGSGGGDPPGEASHVGSHMRTHSWGSPAHLQFLGFASAPSLAVDTLVTLPDEEHPSVPGVDAVCSLGAGTLGRRSHRVSSHPPNSYSGRRLGHFRRSLCRTGLQHFDPVLVNRHALKANTAPGGDPWGAEEPGRGQRKTGCGALRQAAVLTLRPPWWLQCTRLPGEFRGGWDHPHPRVPRKR